MMSKPTPIISRASGMNQKSQEIGIKFTIIDYSNFDKQCSGAHFVSFLLNDEAKRNRLL